MNNMEKRVEGGGGAVGFSSSGSGGEISKITYPRVHLTSNESGMMR